MTLQARLTDPRLLVLPGAANALAARIVEDAGFEAVYVTGAGVANSFLGAPDIGLLSLPEMAAHVTAIREAVAIPLVVDADTGFGNAINTMHAVRTLERAGANAIQLEDQTFPKRCGHFAGKDVVPASEMVDKLRAAVDARRSDQTLIVARTDARAVHGLEEAIDRANRYREAGADVLFVEAPRTVEEVERIAREVAGPKVFNLVEGGATPALSGDELETLGFAIALHANLALLAAIGAMQTVLGELHRRRDATGARELLASWTERQRLVRKPAFDELELRYRDEGDPAS